MKEFLVTRVNTWFCKFSRIDTFLLYKGVGTAEGMTFLIDLLDFFGVNNLTEVKNQYVYVLDDDESWYVNAQGLEHLTTNPNKQCGIKKMVFKDYFSSWEE